MLGMRPAARRLRSPLRWWTGVALAILIWHLVARSQPEYVLPGPQTTWKALVGLIRHDELGGALLLTIERGAIGLMFSCLIGMPLGWAMGTWPWISELLDSWVQVLMSIPPIILPAVAPPVLSAVTVAVGQSVRATVMSELLSTATGLGAQVQQARTNLETADVFALSAVMATLTLALELFLLGPLRRRLARPPS